MENVMDREGVSFDFNNLPDDILLALFNYLSILERRIIGRVCKKWYEISRHPDPEFWKRVVVFIISHRTLPMSVRTTELLKLLPQSVSCLKLYYEYSFYSICVLKFSVLSSTLLKICPNLEELSIDGGKLTETENFRVINLSNALPKKLRILKLREIRTTEVVKLIFEDSYISDIEVFDISFSNWTIDPIFLSQMPRLRELHLGGIRLKEHFFDSLLPVIRKLNILDFKCIDMPICRLRNILEIVRNNGLNLIELHVCYHYVEDSDVRCLKDTTVLPQLKVICLRGCSVSFMEINSLIDSRSSLQIVYVGDVADCDRDKPEFNYGLCNSMKVIKLNGEHFDDDCEHDGRPFKSFKSII